MTERREVSPIIKKSLDGFYAGDKESFLEKYSYIEEVVSRVPKYEAIDPSSASELAIMSWAAAHVCAELIHDIGRESGILETMVKAEEADAHYRSQSKTAAMKKIDAQKDPQFVEIQNRLVAAKHFLDFLRREYQLLVGQHYYCKELIKGVHGFYSPDSGSERSGNVDDLI